MSTEAPSPPEPDVLDLGSMPSDQRRRRILAAVVIMVLVATGAVVAWQWWPRDTEPLTKEELQGVYAGMVRSDGTNDAMNLDASLPGSADFSVEPTECSSLLWAFGRSFPAGMRDGVTTYWDTEAMSMVTLRFDDRKTADAVLADLASDLRTCTDRHVDIRADSIRTSGTLTGTAEQQLAPNSTGLGYILTTTGGEENAPARFIVHYLAYTNTLTVVLRYAFEPADVAGSVKEDRLLTSLLAQMKAVEDLRKR